MSEKEGVKAGKPPKKGGSSTLTFGKRKAEKVDGTARPYKYTVPLTFYWFKDLLRQLANHKNFPDAVAVALAITSVAIAFPSVPLLILIPLIMLAVVLTMVHPLIGLMSMLFETLPMFIYQAPLLGWVTTMIVAIFLFFGYKHYRTITFIYAMAMFPLSFLGAFVEIPAFIFGVLFIGFRRAAISTVVIILMVAMFAGATGIQSAGPILYNSGSLHSGLGNGEALGFMTPSKPNATLANFSSAFGAAGQTFFSYSVSKHIFDGFSIALGAIAAQAKLLIVQIMLWLVAVFAISNFAIKSRATYKGAVASVFGAVIPLAYLGLAYASYQPINFYVVLSFVMTPVLLMALEYGGVSVVRTLDVAKQDFLSKMGDGLEDLTSGAKETLNDIANYASTKAELRSAILAPIEHREIAGAYNVKPAKGILLFGPPGTGKTLIMRALSNEIRGKFFYVKTSSLVSSLPGESAARLSKIFATVRKHSPAILFFDEIDSIASSRELKDSEDSRQLISTLLTEMDGFQKISGVVIVGSTNVPSILDAAMLRPGRFDKIVYMPLPDEKGRAEVFRYHLKKLPVSKDLDYAKLASLTGRYSGADIKNVCEESARIVAEDAIKSNKVLEITMRDITDVIGRTKPSTSISQVEMYETFKMDYERRMHPEVAEPSEKKLAMADVVGLEKAKRAIYEAIEIPILHPNLMKKYDIQNIKGILLFGPPGVGKTMLMRAVSSEIGDVRMLMLSGAELSKFGMEKAELTIKQTFDRARENAPAVIFIDEIDAILPSREGAKQEGIAITSQFLQEMDGIKNVGNIVVVGATNRPESLDPALLRGGRFDKLVFVPPPSKEERAKLFEKSLKKAPVEEQVDFGKLGEISSGYTGADIANVCRQVKMNVMQKSIGATREVRITMDDITEQIKETRPSALNVNMSTYLTFLSMYGRG